MAKKHLLGPFDWFLLIGIVACNIVNSIMTNSFDIIGTISSIAGIICVVLCVNGSIVNYLFGLINVTLSAYICYKSQLWGAAALNGLYYTPMQFIGFFQWRKRLQSGQSTIVVPRKMDSRGRYITAAITVVAIVACSLILVKFGDAQPWQDGASTMLCVVAMILMVRAYMEQWVPWNLSNALFLAMWVALLVKGEPHSGPMVIMWSFYLINSIRGWIEWKKMVDRQEAGEAEAESTGLPQAPSDN